MPTVDDLLRGEIRSRSNVQQVKLFRGLQFGRRTPTDIDAFLDFDGRTFVIIEAKYAATPLPFGQRLAYQNAVDAWERGGARAVCFVVEHTSDSLNEIVLVACPVREYYTQRCWTKLRIPLDLRQSISQFIEGKRVE